MGLLTLIKVSMTGIGDGSWNKLLEVLFRFRKSPILWIVVTRDVVVVYNSIVGPHLPPDLFNLQISTTSNIL